MCSINIIIYRSILFIHHFLINSLILDTSQLFVNFLKLIYSYSLYVAFSLFPGRLLSMSRHGRLGAKGTCCDLTSKHMGIYIYIYINNMSIYIYIYTINIYIYIFLQSMYIYIFIISPYHMYFFCSLYYQ